ncbi:MAG: transporter permease [Bradyrhizobium sp.]|nr:transporter permease [Bradyrhizobium sp.]
MARPPIDALVRKTMWRLMPIIMISYFFAFFDRINIGFAKAQLQVDLGLSNTAYGLGASLFVVGYVLFEVPSNMMLYRTGSRQWLARIMVSWGLATAAMVFTQGPLSFYALRFLIGALEAGFSPGVVFYMTLWFPASHRARANVLLFLASASAGIFGAPLAGLILHALDHVGGLRGWHWLFLFGGMPTVALGVVVWRLLDNRPEDARWLSDEEKALLAAHIAPAAPAPGHSLGAALATPGFLLLAGLYFLIQTASYGLNFWGPDLIRSAGIADPAKVGLFAAIPYICGAVSMIVVARRADASGERRGAVIGCMVLSAFGFAGAGLFAHQLIPLLLSLALIGAGVVAAVPSFWSLPPRLLAGAGAAGGIALINTIGQMGGIVSPIAIGWIKDTTGSATNGLYLIALVSLGAAATLFFTANKHLRAIG